MQQKGFPPTFTGSFFLFSILQSERTLTTRTSTPMQSWFISSSWPISWLTNHDQNPQVLNFQICGKFFVCGSLSFLTFIKAAGARPFLNRTKNIFSPHLSPTYLPTYLPTYTSKLFCRTLHVPCYHWMTHRTLLVKYVLLPHISLIIHSVMTCSKP